MATPLTWGIARYLRDDIKEEILAMPRLLYLLLQPRRPVQSIFVTESPTDSPENRLNFY